jgi:uncharacterized membrane protein (UPF0182 family)
MPIPYSAVVDGRLVWIWDAYTTTNQYPYSDFVDLAEVASPSAQEQAPSLGGDVNYLRNSVKVVVDAYDGSMRYYVADPSDPIIQAWSLAFPHDVHEARRGAARSSSRTSGTPRTSSRSRRSSTRTTTSPDPNVFYGKQDFWALADRSDPVQPRPTAS